MNGLKKQLEHARRTSLRIRHGSLSGNLRNHLRERDTAASEVRELELKTANNSIKEIDQLLKLINAEVDKWRLLDEPSGEQVDDLLRFATMLGEAWEFVWAKV